MTRDDDDSGPFYSQTVPFETKYYWSGSVSAGIKKRCKAILRESGIKNVNRSFTTVRCQKGVVCLKFFLPCLPKLCKKVLKMPPGLSEMCIFCNLFFPQISTIVPKSFEIATVFVGEMRVL